jgi:hypothetical protein
MCDRYDQGLERTQEEMRELEHIQANQQAILEYVMATNVRDK